MPVWPELVVDAFVPSADGEQTRTLYEDDGISTAHERGAYALTEFRLRRQGHEISLDVTPVRASADVLPPTRQLAVRFHLPAGFVPAGSDFTVMSAPAPRAADLFAGAEAPAAAAEGAVILMRAEMDPSVPLALRLAGTPG